MGGTFSRKQSALFYMLFLVAAVLSTIALLFDPNIHFLSPAMMFLVVTVWSRKNSEETITWFGVIHFSPKWLPWVLLVISFMLYKNPVINVMGIVAGFVYAASAGWWLMGTPLVIRALFGEQ